MKRALLKLLFFIFILVFAPIKAHAVQFDLLVLPTNLFSVCDNYFCFPEVSEIVAEDVIYNLKQYPNINTQALADVRAKLYSNSILKTKTENILNKFEETDRIDFQALQEIAKEFNVKSILLISCYAINDKTTLRRNLWNVLEISSAFKISYPFELKTNAVLTDTVNNIVMWSGKYTKSVSDTFGYYSAANQTQAMSQLEKIKQYSSGSISQTISQNVFMRFFPRDVRTFTVKKTEQEMDAEPKKFIPNALEHLSNPRMQKEYDSHQPEYSDDFIFTF
jgi:hypothetical protein